MTRIWNPRHNPTIPWGGWKPRYLHDKGKITNMELWQQNGKSFFIFDIAKVV